MSTPVSGPGNLKNKTAIVTGAAGGIGKAACLALAREGAFVIASDMPESSPFNEPLSEQLTYLRCDVTREAEVESLIQTALNRFGRIDILVNSAGVVSKTPITELSVEEWNWVLGINLTGTFLCCKHAMRAMQEQKSGRIICLGSISGKVGGLVAGPHYVASKAGVHGLVKWLARVGAGYGILVNGIVPGHIRTAMFDSLGLFDLQIPLGRLGQPEDVAELVVFLSTDASNFITGALINVNGGILMDG